MRLSRFLNRKHLRLMRFFLFALLLIGIGMIHMLIKTTINHAIGEEITQTLKRNPSIASIRFEDTNAGLLAFLRRSYTLYNVTLHFNHPHFKAPLLIGALSLHNPRFNSNDALTSGTLDIEDIDLKHYLYLLDNQASHVTLLAKAILKQEKGLLTTLHFQLDLAAQNFIAALNIHNDQHTLLEYRATHAHFNIPEGLTTLAQFTQALKASTVEETSSEFHFSGNFLDPALTAPIPMLQVVTKEMGYYFLKGQLDFKGRFDRQKNKHEAEVYWTIQDAFNLSFKSTFQTASSSDGKQSPLLGAEIVGAELSFHDQGVMKRIFPISKVYLNIGQQDFLVMLESLHQKQTSPPLKKAIQDVITFVRKPHEVHITLTPVQPFDPFIIVQDLKKKNQRNFEQYQQEMSGVNSDDTRKKVTEYFAFKQDEALTEVLMQIGFDTQYR